MWPWGHLAFAYLLYSPTVRLLRRRAPEAGAVIALALGSQFPDLVDKPLGWLFGFSPSGYGIAHSAFVAVPLGLALAGGVAFAASGERRLVGVAFAVGWLSHLVSDVLFAMLIRNPYTVERVMWPLITLPAEPRAGTTLDRVLYYAVNWVEFLVAAHPLLPVLYVTPLVVAGLLWLVDGAPGFPRASWFR
jgi:hypothetical protein